MDFNVQLALQKNVYLKKYLREHSSYYKDLIRNPSFINKLFNLMKNEYKQTLPDKLDKIKQDIGLLNTMMEILK